mgnify:CR=1 FL=1
MINSLAVAIGVMCVLFAVFTGMMLSDQVQMLREDTGTIDKKKALRDSI